MVQRTTSKKKNTENAHRGFSFISGTDLFFFCIFVLFPGVGEVTGNFDFPWYVWCLCFALLCFSFISYDDLGRMPKVARVLFELYITDSSLVAVSINCNHTHHDPRFV